ncbi:cell division protein FtsL [Cochlodiniinecator piscidefendens]|uniref:cell division protein FtsL n=1 Tax=Cochlodiniinecator piscidefendens TaxID=2715756 RepID=UPI00140E6F0E|nr:cell division protein FtsL [Cochlodiniinecator piscidefendens]
MRSIFYILSALAVMGLGFWAYRENYQTQSAAREVRELRQQIGLEREALAVLNAEWAYLNRPDRLRELASINFDRLQLLTFDPSQFARVDQISFPPFELRNVSNSVEVIGTLEGAQE